MTNKPMKTLSVCIIGKPNAGKSTLTNLLLGEKLSIVTPKVQTTRSMITGILTVDEVQILLFDTPGIFEARKQLEKAMVRCAWSSLNEADIVGLLIDSSKPVDTSLTNIIKRITSSNKKIIFIVNKVDIKSKNYTDNIIFLEKNFQEVPIFNISALKNRNIDSLLEYFKSQAKDSEWLYDQDELTTLPSRFLSCEITREQLFLQLEQELPYNLTVECEKWETQSDGSVRINQAILVTREPHKQIIIGQKGSRIKEIGSKARTNIEKLLGAKVHLFLFVKVKRDWQSDPYFYNNMNLKIN